ncbi:hypothetical protein ACFSHQ_00465 [Gemmobacter lanyuensis]
MTDHFPRMTGTAFTPDWFEAAVVNTPPPNAAPHHSARGAR